MLIFLSFLFPCISSFFHSFICSTFHSFLSFYPSIPLSLSSTFLPFPSPSHPFYLPSFLFFLPPSFPSLLFIHLLSSSFLSPIFPLPIISLPSSFCFFSDHRLLVCLCTILMTEFRALYTFSHTQNVILK